eukprot:3678239-Pyramimonas_sp.AAC.1
MQLIAQVVHSCDGLGRCMEKRIGVVKATQRNQAREIAPLGSSAQQLPSDFAVLRDDNPQDRPMEDPGFKRERERSIDPTVVVITARMLVAKEKAQVGLSPFLESCNMSAETDYDREGNPTGKIFLT